MRQDQHPRQSFSDELKSRSTRAACTCKLRASRNAGTRNHQRLDLLTRSGVTGTISHDPTNSIYTLTPSSSLAANQTYTSTLTTGVQDTFGNPLATPFTPPASPLPSGSHHRSCKPHHRRHRCLPQPGHHRCLQRADRSSHPQRHHLHPGRTRRVVVPGTVAAGPKFTYRASLRTLRRPSLNLIRKVRGCFVQGCLSCAQKTSDRSCDRS